MCPEVLTKLEIAGMKPADLGLVPYETGPPIGERDVTRKAVGARDIGDGSVAARRSRYREILILKPEALDQDGTIGRCIWCAGDLEEGAGKARCRLDDRHLSAGAADTRAERECDRLARLIIGLWE